MVSKNFDPETTEKTLVDCIARTVSWCQAVGIRQLTAYDNQGIAIDCAQIIRLRLIGDQPSCEIDTESEVEYPLTPPHSESRSLSPDNDRHSKMVIIEVAELQTSKTRKPVRQRNVLKRRKPKDNTISTIPLTLNLVSQELAKPAIASVARSYIRGLKRTARKTKAGTEFELSADELGSALEGRHGFSSPDFMIIHHISPENRQPCLELHGFPPWQIQLTELYLNRPPKPIWSWWHTSASTSLLEEEFRAALDEFASAEMRLGK